MFNVNIPLLYFICIIVISDIVAAIPISIYGIGLRDGALITLFYELYEISSPVILGLSMYWFVVFWVIPSVIGAFVTMFETKKIV